MIRKAALLVSILPVLAACQPPQTGNDTQSDGSPLQAPVNADVNTLSYRCESGATVGIVSDAGRTVNLDHAGQSLTLQAEAVASGAAYKDAHYRWVVTRDNRQEKAELFKDGRLLETCSRHQESAAPSPGLAPCRADQMELRAGEADAGMGHRQQTFIVTLKEEQACLLPAWPTVRLKGTGAEPPPPIVRTTDSYFDAGTARERQPLTRDGAMMFHIGWSVVPDETAGTDVCPQVSSLQVEAPGGGLLVPVAQDFRACGRGVVLSPFRPSDTVARKSD